MLCTTWIRAICTGRKIGAYFSDIAGAFDRVDKKYLLGKLQNIDVPVIFIEFVDVYLEPRIGRISVEGIYSEFFNIYDRIFQGTVLSSPLWNVFFHDVEVATTYEG